MGKEKLMGGLQTLLQRQQTPEPEPPETEQQPSKAEVLRDTLKDPELKEALQDEELLKKALRLKRFAGGRPRKGESRISQSEGYERICLIANEKKMAKIREIAFRETLTIKQIFEAMCDNLIQTYEEKHGEVTPTDHSVDAGNLFK